MKPVWKEGVFVTPQHLQLSDEYHEVLLEQRLRSMTPHCWGVEELVVDEDELTRGVFKVTRCTAVMPDGMLIGIGPGKPIPSAMTMIPAGNGNRHLSNGGLSSCGG